MSADGCVLFIGTSTPSSGWIVTRDAIKLRKPASWKVPCRIGRQSTWEPAGDRFASVPSAHLRGGEFAAGRGGVAISGDARGRVDIGERFQSLISGILAQAAAGDPQSAEVVETIERERGLGTAATTRQSESSFGLRNGLDEPGTADVLWALTAPEPADRLVNWRGCTWVL